MAQQSEKKGLRARWWTTVDDKIVEKPPVKVRLLKQGKKTRKPEPDDQKKSA